MAETRVVRHAPLFFRLAVPIPVQLLIQILIVKDDYGILAGRQVVNFQYGFRRKRRTTSDVNADETSSGQPAADLKEQSTPMTPLVFLTPSTTNLRS